MNAITGLLADSSPLKDIFTNGCVPLTSPTPVDANLDGQISRVYLLLTRACTPLQKEGIAQLMSRMGQGTIEEARAAVATNDPIPIKEINITSASIPLRYLI